MFKILGHLPYSQRHSNEYPQVFIEQVKKKKKSVFRELINSFGAKFQMTFFVCFIFIFFNKLSFGEKKVYI